MSRRARARCWPALACAALLFASGCDQVGAPLVGESRPPAFSVKSACSNTLECVPPDAGVLPEALEVRETDLGGCAAIVRDDPALCDPSPRDGGADGGERVDDAEPDAATDAGMGAGEPEPPTAGEDDSGDVSAQPGQMGLPPCDSLPHQPVLAQLSCSDLTSRNAPVQDGPELLAAADWRRSNLRIESVVPRTIAVEELTLSDVWIELRGPVTLRIGPRDGALFTFGSGPPAAGTEKIQDLRVTGIATDAGSPELMFEGVRARGVRIGDGDQPFEGRVVARTSELLAVQLLAGEVVLESSRLADGLLHTHMLTGADAVLSGLGIELDRAVLSTSHVRKSQVTRCGDVTLSSVNLTDTLISACETPLRMIDSRMVVGALDGAIEADGSGFETILFGTREPTELVFWTTRVQASGLCAGVQSLAIAEISSIQCSLCESDTFVPDATCELPKSDLSFKNNLCPGLTTGAMLTRCPLPHPPRHRADPRFE